VLNSYEGSFDALEVRELATAVFFDGQHKTQDNRPIPRISCVRSSDAHHHEEIATRNRVTWIRAEKKTFGELKAALALPHRITLNHPETAHAQVIGVHVIGSFITDSWIMLNEGLNALIGSKGSGKTALLECLRFVLNTPVPKERKEDVEKHRQHILGTGGYVECLVRDVGGQHRLITRRMDASDRITITPEFGETTTTLASTGQVFPISILGWHEIESVADHASARIGLLDRAGEPEVIVQSYCQIRDHISQARDAFPLLQRQVRLLDKTLKELWELQRKRSTLTRLSEGKLSQLQNQYDWFLKAEERLDSITLSTSSRRTQLTELIPSRIDTTIPAPPDHAFLGELGDSLVRVETYTQESHVVESESVSSLDSALMRIGDEAQNARKLLNITFQEFRESTYAPAVELLSQEDREILTKQIQVLEETKKLPSVESTSAEQLRELRLLAAQLNSSCGQVCTLRDQIVTTRMALVSALNDELPGIRLEFKRAANREARDRFQGSYPTDGASLIGFLDRYTGNDGYEKLRDLFASLQTLDVADGKWTVENQLIDAKLVDLLDVIDDDDVDIYLEVGKRGFAPIQSLSAGQRCVAVFPLLLRNTRGPLVIDQPEDNLDNRYIADTIGPDLLNKKLGQQYLVTSHNANLVVLTDADLIVHVDSDGAHAEFPAAGFLAWKESLVKESVLGVLDGGEAALLVRKKKYGI
jgi:energy-coupling factor transporter ATP-binding protein EcfA2